MNLNLALDPKKNTQKEMLNAADMDEEYEPEVGKFLRMLLQQGDCFVDCGAHVGFFTVMAAMLVGSEGIVYAFEPDAENYADLMDNVEMNAYEHVKVFRNAVGDKNGEVQLFYNFDNDGGHSLWDPRQHPFNNRTREAEPVMQPVGMVKLDSVVLDAPKIIKIDVEGCELAALRGAEQLLRKYSPAVIVEINENSLDMMGTNKKELETFMESLGYIAYRLDDGSRIVLRDTPFLTIIPNIVFVRVQESPLHKQN